MSVSFLAYFQVVFNNDVVSNFEIEEDHTCIEENIVMPPPSSHGHHSQKQVEAIKELQEYFFVLKKEMPASKVEISSLVKIKDDVIVELVKIIDQVKDRKGLIKGDYDTILKLHQQLDAITLQVPDLRLKGDNTEDVIVAELKQDALQCKLDSHALMVDTFKKLLTIVKVDHATNLEKNSKA